MNAPHLQVTEMTNTSHCCNQFTPVGTRRDMLTSSATGFGMLATSFMTRFIPARMR